MQGKTYCPENSCKRLTIKQFKKLYPGENLPNNPDNFLISRNLSGMYMFPPQILFKLVNSKDPPLVMPFYTPVQLYFKIRNMKLAPFVRSYSNVPPVCFNFNDIEKNENLSSGFKKEVHYLSGTELHLRNIQQSDTGQRLDVENSGGQISVHSPYNFNNPFLNGVFVERGGNIVLRVKQVLKKSLPYPYETNCHDYESEIEERNSPGPTNLMECIEHCKMNLSLLNLDCVLLSIWYPHNYQRCMPENQLKLLGEYHQKCTPQCHEACS
ncbi:hypothetical protein TNCT_35711 [Trichonephila clavata]|uniref:Uncharacterized protein n=1 Tax=Trichonephila clavata TaxID=2740835 RepID=A0A8X6KB35_TRICU|nr:hypothetical protein TNCT_35711 [Trichonephila clavata]